MTVCKVRGITLNYNASQLVNFDGIKGLVLNRPANNTVTVHKNKMMKFKRGVRACVSIVTEPENMIYRISFFNRRCRGDYTSVPFGYK